MSEVTVNLLSGIVRNATPLVIAALGETITERAGVVNLSLNGAIILAAMVGFVTSLLSGSVLAGVIAAMVVGALVALIVAAADMGLRQDQLVVGFVLTLLCADLAQFLGTDYSRVSGPHLSSTPIPLLADIPIIGPVLFRHNWLVYASYVLVIGAWFWLYRSGPGMTHRAVGERPEAAFARGSHVTRERYLYTVFGGGLVGLAGAAYSLGLKPGWATPPNMDGDGWIVLAIVIFGGWHPFRVALGAYLFAALRSLSSALQRSDIGFAVTLLNALPWLLMIGTLALVSSGFLERLTHLLPKPVQRGVRALLHSDPPRALGTRFEREQR